jgi:hypothetical protein
MALLDEELVRLSTIEERHRRLLARLLLVTIATLIVAVVGTIAIFVVERHAAGSQIHTLGQALFFTITQLLTVSSSVKNPITPAARVIDILLEGWAVLVVAGSAGAIASFFQTGDSS